MGEPSAESSTIKTYDLPPPWPETELPEENGSRHFPIEKYWELSKDENYPFDELDLNDDICKKVVLSEIRKLPDIWSSRKTETAQSNWPLVAVGTFKRTGVLLSVNSIKVIYKCAKDNLRNRLRFAVVKKQFSDKQVEEYLWGWDYYPFIRYFRKYMEKWEEGLYEERAGLGVKDQSNEEDLVEPDAKRAKTTRGGSETTDDSCEDKEDDDVIWDDAVSTVKPILLEVKIESKDGLEEVPRSVDGTNYKMNHTYYPPNTLFQTQDGRWTYEPAPRNNERKQGDVAVKQEILDQQYDEDIKHDIKPVIAVKSEMSPEITIISPESSTAKTSAIDLEFENDMKLIMLHASRVARDHPDCVKVLRKGFYQQLLALDEKEFPSTEDLFKYLYENS